MNSFRRTLLNPWWLGLVALSLLGLVIASTSRVGMALVLNLIPALLVMGVPVLILWRVIVYVTDRVASQSKSASVEDRLDELERLKRRAMVTPEEYEAKREEILRDL